MTVPWHMKGKQDYFKIWGPPESMVAEQSLKILLHGAKLVHMVTCHELFSSIERQSISAWCHRSGGRQEAR